MFQACRGNKLDHGVEVADAAIGEPEPKIYRIPEEADFLYAYSTAPGMWKLYITYIIHVYTYIWQDIPLSTTQTNKKLV